MAKIVIKQSMRFAAAPTGVKPANVKQKRVIGPDGRKTIFTIDARSDTFGDDLTFVFEKNVAKARRENKRLFGDPDRVPVKS